MLYPVGMVSQEDSLVDPNLLCRLGTNPLGNVHIGGGAQVCHGIHEEGVFSLRPFPPGSCCCLQGTILAGLSCMLVADVLSEGSGAW